MAVVKGLNAREAKRKTDKLLDMANLHNVADKKIKSILRQSQTGF